MTRVSARADTGSTAQIPRRYRSGGATVPACDKTGVRLRTREITMKTQPVTHQSKQTGRAAMVAAALAVAGVGLTAFVVGVSGGSDAENPPAPDVPPSVEMEVPRGVDQRLYELAEKHA